MRLFTALLLFLVSPLCAAQVQVSGGQLFELPDGSQLVFRLTSPTAYRSFLLDAPPRLVVDLKGAAARGLQHRLESSDVRGVRSGSRNGSDLRLVVDLTRAVHGRVSMAQRDGYHLVLDVFRSRAPVFEHPDTVAFITPDIVTQPVVDPPSAPEPALPPLALVSRSELPRAQAQPATITPAPAPLTTSARTATQSAAVREVALPELITHRRDIVIAIDAGHGGKDPGAIGPSGVREKDVVLAISRRLARLINDEPGMRAILTRDRDNYLRLFERVSIARQHNADLFISIHADAFTSPRPRGASVYMLSTRGASSSMARWLAESENRSDRIAGSDLDIRDRELRQVVFDMVHDAVLAESSDVGRKVLERMGGVGRLHSPRIERANFAVLRAPDMPSILVETGFISNPEEERLLNTASHQQRLATAIMDGVREFARSRPGLGLEIVDAERHGGSSARRYVVQRGDTLSGIARRHDVNLNQLLSINGLNNAHHLPAGMTLRIPEG